MHYVMLRKQNKVLTLLTVVGILLLMLLLLWAGSYYFRTPSGKYRLLMLNGSAVVVAPQGIVYGGGDIKAINNKMERKEK